MITVYILRSLDHGKRYVGITGNLARRLAEHRRPSSTLGNLLGAFEVLQAEEFTGHVQARPREKFPKSGQGRRELDRKYPT